MVNSAACIPGAVFDTLSRPVQVEAAGCGHVVTTDGSRAALADGVRRRTCRVGRTARSRRRASSIPIQRVVVGDGRVNSNTVG